MKLQNYAEIKDTQKNENVSFKIQDIYFKTQIEIQETHNVYNIHVLVSEPQSRVRYKILVHCICL